MPIHVTAAIIINEDAAIFVARRGPGKHLAGVWEFPGGKVEAGEFREDCLKREIKEELGMYIEVGPHFLSVEHSYGDKDIHLHSYISKWIGGYIEIFDHDRFLWCHAGEMTDLEFAPADIPIVKKLLTDQPVAL